MRILFGLILLLGASAAVSAMPPPEPFGAEPLGNVQEAATISEGLAAGELRAGQMPSTASALDLSASDPALGKLMDRIEAGVALPKGASPLTGYVRLYAWADEKLGKVTAIYVRGDAPGRKWVSFEDLPTILDGGCGVIELIYDVPRGGTDEIGCNGVR